MAPTKGEASLSATPAMVTLPITGSAYLGMGTDPDARRSRMAPRLATAVLVVVFCGFCLVASLSLAVRRGVNPADMAFGIASMVALLGVQLLVVSRHGERLPARARYTVLAVQALLVYVPLYWYAQDWTGLPGFLAGSVLLLLHPVPGWTVFALVVASMVATQAVYTPEPYNVGYTLVSTVITGLVVYGLTRLASLVSELNAARMELARMAVAEERLRFARDLHDLLGYSLSAITLKCELTSRLVGKDPGRTGVELDEILAIARRALADVRTVARGYRELSLDDECRSAASVLAAAEVSVRMNLDHGELPVTVRTVLATILREGVTNVLRHSKAEWCEISVRETPRTVDLDIVNDGVQDNRAPGPADGSGIHNLSYRVAMLGGGLRAGVDRDGNFRLHATIPLTADQASP